MRTISFAMPLVLVALTACSAVAPPASSPAASPPTSPDGPVLRIESDAAVDGPGISVAEARASGSAEPVLVNGALFIDANGDVLLCEAIAESFPPQCGGERLTVVGLDELTIADLQEEGPVRWAEGVQLFGTIEQ